MRAEAGHRMLKSACLTVDNILAAAAQLDNIE